MRVKFMSPECWKKGHCIQCGCIIREKIKADMGCENAPYCYPDMMSKENWEFFKRNHSLSFDKIDINKI